MARKTKKSIDTPKDQEYSVPVLVPRQQGTQSQVYTMESTPPPPPGSTVGTNSSACELLNELGLWTLWRDQRERVAQALDAAGVLPDQIHALWDEARTSYRDDALARRVLAGLLQDQERLQKALADVAVREARGARYPGRIDHRRSRSMLEVERRSWPDQDRENYIRCRVRDGVDAETAAREYDQ